MNRVTWMFAASVAVIGIGVVQVFGSTATQKSSPSMSPITVNIPLTAYVAPAEGTSPPPTVKDVRFVVVNQAGHVLAKRNGPGTVKVTIPQSGFWEAANANESSSPLNKMGVVEILAYAPHMVDTIMLDVVVSPGPVATVDPIPMKPMIDPKGHNTPNEPNIVLGTDVHHLVADGVSNAYSKYANITSSYLRNSK